MQTKAIILYDSICGLCAQSIQFIINHDSKNQFKFVSLHSPHGRKLIRSHRISTIDADSIILIEGKQYLVKSGAALRIIQRLSGPWAWLVILSIIPARIRDWCYDVIARNRYKWFGEVKNCALSINKDTSGKFE